MWRGPLDVPGKTERLKQPDRKPSEVELPPGVTVPRRIWIGVMVIVPTLAARKKADDRIVAAQVARLVATITPEVADRVDRPRYMPDEYYPQGAEPDQDARTKLRRIPGVPAQQQTDSESEREESYPRDHDDFRPIVTRLNPSLERIMPE